MFWRKKNRKRDVSSAEERELVEMKRSLNKGRWKRYLALGAIIGTISGGLGYGIHAIDREYSRKGRYEQMVQKSSSRFRKKLEHAVAAEACMRPGSSASVLEDSISLWGVTARKQDHRIIDGKKTGTEFCIRPVDGGQEISLESRIHISGLEAGDFSGVMEHNAGITLEYSVPDILPYTISISALSINDKPVPVRFLTKEGCSCKKEGDPPSLDLGQLLAAGVIDGSDFIGGLDISISSSISIGQIKPVKGKDVAGTDAYAKIIKNVSQYLKSDSRFPAEHKTIRKIVSDYGKGRDNVMDIMQYALDVTDAALDYYLPELNLSPVEAYKDGRGDCDDYASLYVTILRAFGIPARYVEGSVTNYSGTKLDGRHAWAEVLVPLKDNSYRWVLVEPTWADNKSDPYSHINFVDNRFLYDISFSARFSTDKRSEVNILQQHEWMSVDTGKLPGKGDGR